jgi:deoxyribose-phosphate aldolase
MAAQHPINNHIFLGGEIMPVDISKLTKKDVAGMMDYALLSPELRDKDYLEGCQIVQKYGFAAIYVLPAWMELIVDQLRAYSKTNPLEFGGVISFPYGTGTTAAKLSETEEQIKLGATAMDLVANTAWLRDGRYDLYQKDCDEFVKLCHSANVITKIIINVGYFSLEEVEKASKIVIDSGSDYVKTATGAGPVGRPNFDDVEVMLKAIEDSGQNVKLKVSGVIEPRINNAYCFIRMGAHRIGTRGAPAIVDSLPKVQKALFP